MKDEVGVEWGTLAQWVGPWVTSGVALMLATWGAFRGRDERAFDDLRKDIGRVFERLDETDQRLSKVEVEIEHVPTKEQLHALDVKITAQGAMLQSIQSTMNRLQEYLLERESK